MMLSSTASNFQKKRILFLVRGDADIRADLFVLRELCKPFAEIRLLSVKNLGQSFLQKIKDIQGDDIPELLFCDEFVEPGLAAVLKEVRSHRQLRHVPCCVFTARAETALELEQAKISAVLRPYSLIQLEKILSSALSLASAQTDLFLVKHGQKNKKKLSSLAPYPVTTSEIYQQGIEAYQAQKYAWAKELFLQVLKRKPDHCGALFFLAGLGQPEENGWMSQDYLVLACASAKRQRDRQWSEKATLFLPEGLREKNIFVLEAEVHIAKCSYSEAVLSFFDALAEDGQGRHAGKRELHGLIARSCQLTDRPEEHMQELCKALHKLGHDKLALAVKKRLLPPKKQVEGDGRSSHWLDRFPLLQDLIEIVCQTVRMWRHA